tara:strand:- start:278 stop:454 length:177 start_codon:yes stop_codon:yes gene_type:complete
MNTVNDNSFSWLNDLNERTGTKILDKGKTCDWLIVGAGYTGKGSLYRSIFYVCSQNFQ